MKKLILLIVLISSICAKDYPLFGYANGVELNIPRLFASTDDYGKGFVGAYSYFDFDSNVEYIVPWSYIRATYGEGYYGKKNQKHWDFDTISIDFHYRKFLSKESYGGFYVSSFVRGSYLKGVEDIRVSDQFSTTLKFGGGVGFGYRFFPMTQRVYWGLGIMYGQYFIGENDKYATYGGVDTNTNDDSKTILEFDLLKIGYAF